MRANKVLFHLHSQVTYSNVCASQSKKDLSAMNDILLHFNFSVDEVQP